MLIKSQVELNVDQNTQSAKFRGMVVTVTSIMCVSHLKLDLVESNFLFNHINQIFDKRTAIPLLIVNFPNLLMHVNMYRKKNIVVRQI